MLVLILHFQVMIKGDGVKEIQVEKMRLDSELYKGVSVDDRKNASSIVPLEEALVINSAGQRRELIMDVLNDNPREYIEFLQKAGDNDDTEVVHYAVTAMVEISKENDHMLQKFERKHSANPGDYTVLDEYCSFLWNCLEQNLMQGQVEIMNRNTFNELIREKLAIKETLDDYIRLVKNLFKLNFYTEAGEAIKKMDTLYPESEDVLLIKTEYYASLGNGDRIKEILEEAENKKIYLSAAAKEVIAFWKS
ncbi:MAG: hypothetical protein II998_03970 [Clostridia bacterium]|nr:hypothetical protein [Clostridia bacterium]